MSKISTPIEEVSYLMKKIKTLFCIGTMLALLATKSAATQSTGGIVIEGGFGDPTTFDPTLRPLGRIAN